MKSSPFIFVSHLIGLPGWRHRGAHNAYTTVRLQRLPEVEGGVFGAWRRRVQHQRVDQALGRPQVLEAVHQQEEGEYALLSILRRYSFLTMFRSSNSSVCDGTCIELYKIVAADVTFLEQVCSGEGEEGIATRRYQRVGQNHVVTSVTEQVDSGAFVISLHVRTKVLPMYNEFSTKGPKGCIEARCTQTYSAIRIKKRISFPSSWTSSCLVHARIPRFLR